MILIQKIGFKLSQLGNLSFVVKSETDTLSISCCSEVFLLLLSFHCFMFLILFEVVISLVGTEEIFITTALSEMFNRWISSVCK